MRIFAKVQFNIVYDYLLILLNFANNLFLILNVEVFVQNYQVPIVFDYVGMVNLFIHYLMMNFFILRRCLIKVERLRIVDLHGESKNRAMTNLRDNLNVPIELLDYSFANY